MRLSMKTLGLAAMVLLFGQYGSAKDLYVALTGNDAVTYGNNSITNPWATPNRAWAMAMAGDVVHFRQGTYVITSTIDTRNIGNHGTAENRITFTSYINEMATFDCRNVDTAFMIQKDYNTITRMNFINYAVCFELGYQESGHHATFTYNTGTSNRDGGYAQHGFIATRQGDYFTVEHNRFSSPKEFINTPAIMIFTRKNYIIRHNEFYNLPKGVYHKHPNNVNERDSINVVIAYNYFKNCLYGISNTGHAAKIHNNVFDNSSLRMGESGGAAANFSLSDFNIIENNTFYFIGPLTTGEDPSMGFSDNLSDPDPYPGCTNNTIKNNIFTASVGNHIYAPLGSIFNNTYDYNMYHNNSSIAIVQESHVNYYTLASWQTKNGTDANSYRGTPAFAGGATPTTIAGFALAAGSPGKNAGSDGRDVGADITKVGIQTSRFTITSPNGGEAWQRGESRPITWTHNGVTGNVAIELVQNGAAVGIIAENVAATAGTFTWTIGRLANGTVITGTGLKIRIRSASGAIASTQDLWIETGTSR